MRIYPDFDVQTLIYDLIDYNENAPMGTSVF